MKVVVVKVGEYSDQTIVGVFSSEEKANEYIMQNTHPNVYYWDAPYIDGEYEIDDGLEDNSENPIMYYTEFRVDKKGNTKNIILTAHVNDKIKTRNEREFKFEINAGSFSSFYDSGYIVLEKEYPEEKLIKIIADKVYQEYYNHLTKQFNAIQEKEDK